MNRFACLLFLALLPAVDGQTYGAARRQSQITAGPQGAYPYLFKGSSRKDILQREGMAPWSIVYHRPASIDTLHIVAFRVEFQRDTSEHTTGNGLFGINQGRGSRSDIEEGRYYTNYGRQIYRYDNLEHDSAYFANQLEFVKNYFGTVSRDRLHIAYTIYPRTGGYDAYQVPHTMPRYSPGAKLARESWDEYYYRRTVGLMRFVKDAITVSDTSRRAREDSPFAGLWLDSVTVRGGEPVLRDSLGRKTALLLIHAGASYLTDGGYEGYFGQDTPSDMIDAFVSPDFFEYFADSLGFDTMATATGKKRAGVLVKGDALLLDELMMVSETSNQDSLNWGIHGILVNQIARQLGIPDLFSTMSGISGIGAFCIMDFAGYSAGQGFIPPWPSAWVRAFMGWDTPVIAEPELARTYNITAVSAAGPGDTTILLVPINGHEYYLIENRQRNLSGQPLAFNYDTSENDLITFIDQYDPVRLDSAVLDVRETVILSVRNLDISIPASGILVWHIDEDRIRDRLAWNVLNADSLYRAVSLEEADGIQDLGILFQDAFYQAAFDYGGAQDVFPHLVRGSSGPVTTMGPFTRPSTQSNDGGHTYLKLTVDAPTAGLPTEVNLIRDAFVENYSDSVIGVKVEIDPPAPEKAQWHGPRQMVPGQSFEPVLCDITGNDDREIAVLDTSGRLHVWALSNGVLSDSSLGDLVDSVVVLSLRRDTAFTVTATAIDTLIVDTLTGDTIRTLNIYDTTATRIPVRYLARIPDPASFPTSIGGTLYVPGGTRLHVFSKTAGVEPVHDSIEIGRAVSSYVCNYAAQHWAVGCSDGRVVTGSGPAVADTITPSRSARAPIEAIAVLDTVAPLLVAVDSAGLVSIIDPVRAATLDTFRLAKGIAPYTVVTADLNTCDADTAAGIVVCDSRQGLWVLTSTGSKLAVAEGWKVTPNDWAAYYAYLEDASETRREFYPFNPGSPALADLNADGTIDIVVGGTNGIYAFNLRGALLSNQWPSFLDNRYWYQRGSVSTSPVVASDDKGAPLVLFASPTGENVTIAVADIDSTDRRKSKIYYTTIDGHSDSISNLDSSFIDTLLVFSDSIVLPYVLPGGFIDARNGNGERPSFATRLPSVGVVTQSYWPLTVGGAAATAPMLGDIDGDGAVDVVAVSARGWLYRWEFTNKVIKTPLVWPMAGNDGSRTFTYRGPPPVCARYDVSKIQMFYNYPNPTRGSDVAVFKYRLTKPARKVRLDIYTYTGYHVYSSSGLRGAYPDWNEAEVSLSKLGPAVYRCRLEATFEDGSDVKYWKMAVVK